MATNVAMSAGAGTAQDATVTVSHTANGDLLVDLNGAWTTRHVGSADSPLRKLANGNHRSAILDLSGISALDTAGTWLVERTLRSFRRAGVTVQMHGERSEWKTLFEAVKATPDLDSIKASGLHAGLIPGLFASLGALVVAGWKDFIVAMHMLGATIRGAQLKIGRDHGISPAAIVHQLDRMGVGALPVVILMSFIIGAIVAQQGAFQLRYFGAEIFVVDLVGVLVLREIGVLLTAIMVAGRSGSAITAEIGSMKMREEIDALKVIGLNPIGVLVFPRLVALVFALPLLTIVADLVALAGASMVAWSYSGISPAAFVSRLREAIDMSTYFAGLIKAPFMAMIIGIVASVEGMKVGGSAESLGRHVTASVVKAIFVVIVVDGLFAMFYAAIDF